MGEGAHTSIMNKARRIGVTMAPITWTHTACSVCAWVQNAAFPVCARCGVIFTGETLSPMAKRSKGDEVSSPAKRTKVSVAVDEAKKLVEEQTTPASIKASAKVWTDFQSYLAGIEGGDAVEATDEHVMAFLHALSKKGRTALHDPMCRGWGEKTISPVCGAACALGAAPSTISTKSKLLAIAFNRANRSGAYGGSALKNNPVQSSKVKSYVKRFMQRAATGGFEASPRDIISTKVLAQALIMCSRWVTKAIEKGETAQKGSDAWERAAYERVLWTQMGAVCSAAHYRGQRAQSMAAIRSRSVAVWEGGSSRVLFLNALLTKTRRTGRKSTLVMPNRSRMLAHICPVAWYDRYCEALKNFGIFDQFSQGSFFFCKVWTEVSSGSALRRVDPLSQAVVQTWSLRLKMLCKEVNTGTQVIGMSGLRGGGAVAAVLTCGRRVKDVMSSAEWSSIKTFKHYTQFHTVLAGAPGGGITGAPTALSDLIASYTEDDYEVADKQPLSAQPFVGVA